MHAGKFITTALLLAVVSVGAAQDANRLPTLKRRMLTPGASAADANNNDGHIDDDNGRGHRILQECEDIVGKKTCMGTAGCTWTQNIDINGNEVAGGNPKRNEGRGDVLG